jgi:hypothetical protein
MIQEKPVTAVLRKFRPMLFTLSLELGVILAGVGAVVAVTSR